MKPNFSPDLLALVDQEHANVRDLLDQSPQILSYLHQGAPGAMVGRLIAIDCLCFAHDPAKMMYRLAAWDRVMIEHGA